MTTSALILGPMLRYVDTDSASVWVETARAGQVTVRADARMWSARTFAVHGHHYALVQVDDLAPGTTSPYAVDIDGVQVWPPLPSRFPASVISTLTPGAPLKLAFGSCRTSVPHDEKGNRSHGVDALRSYALQMAALPGQFSWPDLVLFLGDQVYADTTSEQMQEFIRARRDLTEPPGEELADFEEYAHLYGLAWSDPANRWLLSTVPTAMIFDDHDIRDDWNASLSWKREMEQTSWWHGRLVSGLASYWVYQHLGNLSPADREVDEIWRFLASHDGDAELDLSERLDAFVERAAAEPASYRWSYCRDYGDSRLIVIDSRIARRLDPADRALIDDDESGWLDERMRGGFRHLLVGTSLPFLLPTGLHHLEAWNEATAEGAWGAPMAAVSEKLRQALDLEHWAAFQSSFRRVAQMATDLADGKRGPAPDTITFLSGDVHYSYVAEVERSSGSRIIQAVCSPIRNPLALPLRSFSAVLSYAIANRPSEMLARSAGVPVSPLRWRGIRGPWFENCLASVSATPAGLRFRWITGVVRGDGRARPRVTEISALTMAPRRNNGG
ncbi:alkaline phosphatase D family protein [Cryobacterium sp. TMB1-7]|uniref:alkaline phosphatase D family protein n=1 Tax=Cryobacterium sp. TMB1-7 TaxID=2555866 RepID=UPI00106A186D|nr:alkaline phosphatase D family protein [Cryobacterium sp. TMB1-7]TFC59327.1 alkaline phosphatase family protein [Cryobacterium sp. TMB1-7]